MAEDKDTRDAKAEAGVATQTENARLKHTAELVGRGGGAKEKGAVTTRDDATDAGVPMLQGDPSEPQGPEDAFGPGPKRGDYSERTGGVNSFESVAVDDGDDDVWIRDGDGNPVDRKPLVTLNAQTPRASNQGEVAGKKGGVETTDDD